MSEPVLVNIMRHFAGGEIDASLFVKNYMAEWRRWRDSGGGSDVFDRAFTAADCFSEKPRTAIDISAATLKSEIGELLTELDATSN